MSLAKLFYVKETFRSHVRQWQHAYFHRRRQLRRERRFALEALEPRLLLSATPTEVVATQPIEAAAVTVPQGNLPSIDVDLNGTADALTDGLLIVRYLFGFTGTALTNGLVDPGGGRTDPTAIKQYLDSIRSTLDVDLNRSADALSDGIVIVRNLFGFTGNALTNGVVDSGGGRTDPTAISTFLDNMNPARELIAPLVTAGLQQDTGLSASDAITINPTITGTIADISQIGSFTAGFDATPVANFTNVLGDLLTTGTFTLSTARMDQVAGGTLADGIHTLHLRVTDARGNVATLDRAFTLDRTVPAAPSFDLAVTSDTGTLGDQQTTAAVVTVTGQTDPTATIQLVGPGTSTLSNGTGTFQLPNINLALGANSFTLRATDVAGNHSDFSRTLTRLAGTAQADTVLTWTQAMLDAIQRDASTPPVASRGMAMVSLAIYDTLNAIDGTPGYYVSLPAPPGSDPNAAAAEAAYRVLSYLYPGQQSFFDSQLAASLAPIANGAGKTNGIALGQSIADAIIAIRSTDGWNDFVDYVPGTDPGDWQPTAPMFDEALLPQWADLTPFALTSPHQFRPAGPPDLTSAAYAAAVNEVESLGAATGSTRTADQTQIARFWADGAGTITPAGHWDQIAQQIALQQGNSLSANARLFAELNVALADAAITAWNTKYDYQFWRPITAIQNADLDGNAATTADTTWTSLLITPPFPEYISGHSTFSGAAAEILTNLFGNNVAFSTTSPGLPGVTRTFTSFEQAAQEAGRSRIYGGIHFEFSNQDGLAAGHQVADAVLSRFTVTTDTQGPKIVVTQPQNTVTKTNFTLTGQVLDNLSGVAALQAQLDIGAFAPVTFDASGHFSYSTTLALDGAADGAHSVTFQARDDQNNLSALLFSFTLDTKAPLLTLASPTDNATLTVDSSLTGTADATGSTLTELCYKFDNGTLIPVSFDAATENFDLPLDLSKLAVGSHTLSLRAQDQAGNVTTVTKNVTLAAPIPLTIIEMTPTLGEIDVGTTVRPEVFFSRPINTASLNNNNFFATDSAGAKLAATIVPSQDGTFAWLFFTNPMPSASTIILHVDGTTILAAGDGQPLDADGDGTPGGMFTSTFSTVSLVPLQGTTLSGKVLDPGPDLKPMTFDDLRAGPDGVLNTSDDLYLNPIAGVKVFIVGLEGQAVFTDAQGNFSFSAVPSGDIKIAIEGPTATNAPAGLYFPEMVMDLNIKVGQANTVMGTMGTSAEQAANLTRPEVYLPRLQTSILQTVSSTAPTVIHATPEGAPNLTPEQRDLLTLTIQPGSLIGFDGQPITNGQVGISTVPPELVRDMLPDGIMQLAATLTLQAPGVARFAVPVAFTFPNLYGGAPGSQFNFYSFDHDTGNLVIQGTATVSADGKFVTSDPGTGITKPGWHGPAPGGLAEFKPGVPCVSASETALAAQRSAENGLATGLELVHERYEHAFVTDLKDFGVKSSGAISEVTGFFFNALNVVKDAEILFDEESTPAEKAFASTTLVLKVAIFTAGAEEVALLEALQFMLSSIEAANIGFDLAEAVLKFSELLDQNAECDPSMHEAAKSRVDRLKTFTNDLDQKVERQKTRVERLQTFGPEIGENLSHANFHEANFGYSDQERAGLVSLLGQYEEEVSAILADGIFLNDIPPLLDQFNALASLYVDSTPHPQSPSPVAPAAIPIFNSSVAPTGIPIVDSSNYSVYWAAEIGGSVLRGQVPRFGEVQFFGQPDQLVRLTIYDPITNKLGGVVSFNKGAGTLTNLGIVPLLPTTGLLDTDGEGLVDEAEFVVGTSSTLSDTDGDHINDFDEVRQGLDPLGGRIVSTGVIASLPLLGQAKEVAIEGSTLNAEQQTAYVATGTYGMAIVNASTFAHPIVLSQLKLSGDATDVAVDSRLKLAAVATNSGGIQIINVTNPLSPTVATTINASANQVEIVDGLIYATVGSELRSYDLITGEKVQSLDLSGGIGTLTGLAREGQTLYTMDTANNLTAIAIDSSTGLMVKHGTRPLSNGGGKLFVGNSVAYVSTKLGDGAGGFLTVNVSNIDVIPPPISDVDSLSVEGDAIVANGSGLGIAVGSIRVANGSIHSIRNALDVLNVTNLSNTASLLTSFDLPASPYSVALGSGIAFVADGTSGLQVVNYEPFDNQGQPPTVTMTATVTDADPAAPGIQVQEGTFIPVRAVVNDDVQARNVELLVNGQAVQNDVAFPFDLTAVAPKISQLPNGNIVTIQVRATDTGGNTATSAPLTLNLVPDTFAPTLASSSVPNNAVRGTSFRTVEFRFSEALDPTKVTAANFVLTGPTGPVSPQDVFLSADGRTVRLTYAQLAIGNYQLAISTGVTDRAGNALAAPVTTNFRIAQFTAVWINQAGGAWNVATNWDTGKVPGIRDDVLIDVPNNVTITYSSSSGTTEIRSLKSNNPFTMTGGTLIVDKTIQVNNNFVLAGGTLKDATVLTGSGAATFGPGSLQTCTLDGVTLLSPLTLADRATLIIHNGLTLQNATVTMQSSNLISFEGTQTVGGTGTFMFASTTSPSDLRAASLSGVSTPALLTLGSGITVRGTGSGRITWQADNGVVLQGTVIADAPGKTITVEAATVDNQGTVSASNGGTFVFGASTTNTLATNTGQISANGGTLNLGGSLARGAWTNSGTISAINNSTVNLGGVFTLNSLGSFQRTGGTVNVTGILDLGGGALALNATTGPWNLSAPSLSGTIKNGTIGPMSGGATLGVAAGTGGTLDGITLLTDFTLSNAQVTVNNGLVLGNGATVTLADTGGTTLLNFVGSQALSGNGSVIFGGTGSGNEIRATSVNSNGIPAAVLTIGSGMTVRGGTGLIRALRQNDGFVIQGTVQADTNGKTITITAGTTSVNNQGTITALNGGILDITNLLDAKGISISGGGLTLRGTWTNSGSLSVTNNSTLTLSGTWSNTGTITSVNSAVNLGAQTAFTLANLGTFSRSNGTVNLTGTLDLTGTTLALDATTGSWNVSPGGSLKGGLVTATGGAALTLTGGGTRTFDGMTLATDVTLPTANTLSIRNALTLQNAVVTLGAANNQTTRLDFVGTQSVAGTGSILFGGSTAGNAIRAVSSDNGTTASVLTLGPGITIQTVQSGALQNGFANDGFINQGTIQSNVAAKVITVTAKTFANQGALVAMNGGNITMTVSTFTNTGTVTVVSPSTITVNGQPLSPTQAEPLIIETNSGSIASSAFLSESTNPAEMSLVLPSEETGTDASMNDSSLAYVQQSWIQDFVSAGPRTLSTSNDEEELVIALP